MYKLVSRIHKLELRTYKLELSAHEYNKYMTDKFVLNKKIIQTHYKKKFARIHLIVCRGNGPIKMVVTSVDPIETSEEVFRKKLEPFLFKVVWT